MTLSRNLHLVGIGGSGMSGLARILLARGCRVSGSDLRHTEATQALARQGASIRTGHGAENLPARAELVVRSAAIGDDNPEIEAARRRGLRILKYAEALGELSREKETIAVCGTHGKTTTTGMIATILETAGLGPTYLLGSPLVHNGLNAEYGRGHRFVVEACEYDRSFLNLSPNSIVLTNIEEDHLDYYRNLDDILSAFEEFCGRVPPSGRIFPCVDNANAARIAQKFRPIVETAALNADADWKARILEARDGWVRFEVVKYGKTFDEFVLAVPGMHNVSNALQAIACATTLGVGKEFIQLALAQFRGTRRRMEHVGETGHGTPVIDDYAHHPTEIQTTLKAVKEKFAGRKLWCVFQPHQHSRTRTLFKEFVRCFADADVVLIPDIYTARDAEADRESVSSQELVRAINETGKPALYMSSFDEIAEFVSSKVNSNSVVVMMGAGNIDEVARRVVAR
jgi:UDP-N-acetylmuramate--alanine ligase